MTLCEKPVRRRVRCASNLVRGGFLNLTLYPEGKIGLKELKRQTEFEIGLADVWRYAIDITNRKFKKRVDELKKSVSLKEARKQARKELGLKQK